MREIISGNKINIFIAGVILYVLVCGQLPWAVGRDGRVEDLDALLNAQYDIPKGCDMSNGKASHNSNYN